MIKKLSRDSIFNTFRGERMNKINKIFKASMLNENNGYLYNPVIMHGIAFDSGMLFHYKDEIDNLLKSTFNGKQLSEGDFNKIKTLYSATRVVDEERDLEKAYQMAKVTTCFNNVLKFVNKKMRYMDDFETVRVINEDNTEYMVNAEKITEENGYEEIAFDYIENEKTVTCIINFPNEEKCRYSITTVENNEDKEYIVIDETCDGIDIFLSKEDEYDPIMNKEISFYISEEGLKLSAELRKHSSTDSTCHSLGDIERSLKFGFKPSMEIGLVMREHYFDEEYIQMQEEMIRMMEENPSEEPLSEEELNELVEVDSPLYDDGLLVEPTGVLKIDQKSISLNDNEIEYEESDFDYEDTIKQVLVHPRNKELVRHVISELENAYPGIGNFILSKVPQVNNLLKEDIEIDENVDDLIEQIYNPACDFDDKRFFKGDVNDKGYNK